MSVSVSVRQRLAHLAESAPEWQLFLVNLVECFRRDRFSSGERVVEALKTWNQLLADTEGWIPARAQLIDFLDGGPSLFGNEAQLPDAPGFLCRLMPLENLLFGGNPADPRPAHRNYALLNPAAVPEYGFHPASFFDDGFDQLFEDFCQDEEACHRAVSVGRVVRGATRASCSTSRIFPMRIAKVGVHVWHPG